MICQSCRTRPATVKVRQKINGRPTEIKLCYTCAQQHNLFGNNPGSIFDSFFGGQGQGQNLGGDPFFGESLGRSYRPKQEINLVDYFSEKAKEVVSSAAQKAHELGAKTVDTEHLLWGISEEEEVGQKILEKMGVKPEELQGYLEENMSKKENEDDEEGESEKPKMVDFTPRAKKAFELAFRQSREMQHQYIGPEHILLGLVLEGEGMASQTLQKYGITADKLRKAIATRTSTGAKPDVKPQTKSTTPTLDKYSNDLTQMARDDKLDPVIGRTDEVARVVQVLSRRTKNNPVLIGEPGVGKTAIAEGLAQKVVSGNIPETLKDKRVVALDISAMVAGTKYRGEFEKRLKKALNEIEKEKNKVILFIDELHTIVGAGGSEGAIDASNILKPALARGQLQAIGATTLNEYKKYIEKDSALERRFQPVLVDEPTVEDSIAILRGLRDKYEAHHKTTISDEAIVAAASLSDRYIKDRFLPDKAIDLIDEAASKIRIQSLESPEEIKKLEKEIKNLQKEKAAAKGNRKKVADFSKKIKKLEDQKKELDVSWRKDKGTGQPAVLATDIEKIVSEWTGIPVTQLAEEEVTKLLKLEERLHQRVIGQDEAVNAVAEAVRRGRAGLKDPSRPIGSFIFLGPTGVGKTELAKALAEQVFGDEDALIRVDMSEYMEQHSVAKLTGSPPGYVGHEEGGQLTEKVRRKPYSVILLDEIEKAHPDVFNVLLQILDDGRLTDSKGRTVDFKNTIIIATSNIGSEKIQDAAESQIGFEGNKKSGKKLGRDELKKELLDELKKTFKPEFINRVDEVIIFEALSEPQIKKIVDLLVEDVQRLLRGQGISLEVSAKAKTKIATEGYDPMFGARPLKRLIQKKIENPLSVKLLSGDYKNGDNIKVDVKKDEFVFSKGKKKKETNAKK
ncbi:AAA family ATPase [Patescibacteria group bacterium]